LNVYHAPLSLINFAVHDLRFTVWKISSSGRRYSKCECDTSNL